MRNFKSKILPITLILGFATLTSMGFVNCSGEGFDAHSETRREGADPLLDLAWHLQNVGQKAFSLNGGQAGNDIRLYNTWSNGVFGRGVTVLVSDDGVEHDHEDLAENMATGNVHLNYYGSQKKAAQALPLSTVDNHGTNVAGVIAAVRDNGLGSAGVAPRARIVASNFLSSVASTNEASMIEQANADVDIVNMSWGASQNTLSQLLPNFLNSLTTGVTNGRGGKGRIFVKAGGNDFLVNCKGTDHKCLGNANFDADNTTPYTILVAALAANGQAASYSSPGANLWITSMGGEQNESSPNIVTTDRSGCEVGTSQQRSNSSRAFEKGGIGNEGCKYTTNFSGTSASAPIVSGAIALMLEVNPQLTWRDVKYILAKTATPVQYEMGPFHHPLNLRSPGGHIYEQGWVRNKAGFHFHNWFGFGRINVDAAVQMARNFRSEFGDLVSVKAVNSSPFVIVDNHAGATSSSAFITRNLTVEAVRIKLTINHADVGDLGVELISPQGTKSIIMNVNNGLRGTQNLNGRPFLTNAFYGESAYGDWRIRIIDGKEDDIGQLNSWEIEVFGH